MIIFKIQRNIVKFVCENSKEESLIKKSLSFSVDGAFFSEMYQNGRWDGKKKFYDKNNEFYLGLLGLVTTKLDKAKIEYKLDYLDVYRCKVTVTPDMLDSRLYDHQRRVVLNFFEKRIGINIVPTRGGKTFTASETIRLLLQQYPEATVVFMVDTTDLFNQALKEISGYLGKNPKDIGQVRGTTKLDLKQINIISVQTATALLYPTPKQKKKLKDKTKQFTEFVNNVSYLIVDEVQEYGSDKRINIIKKFRNFEYFMSISAEPYKSENKMASREIKAVTGGVIITIPEEELVESGVLVKSSALILTYDHTKLLKSIKVEESETYHQKLEENVIENEGRNKVLLYVIKVFKELKLKTLVIFSSKKHGYKIQGVTKLPFICGDDNTTVRDIAKDEFLKGKGKVLLASNIYKKGVTLPQAQVIINVNGGKEISNTLQIVGRVKGRADGKTGALIVDFIDVVEGYFSEHALKRLNYYSKTIKEEDIYVLECDDSEFKHDFKNTVLKWIELNS